MSAHPTLAAPAAELRALVDRVDTERMSAPTPCAEFDVRALLNHLLWAVRILTLSAGRQALPADLDWTEDLVVGDWRTRLTDGLTETAEAWDRDPAVWQGMTVIGGGTRMPAETAGELSYAELVLHGWDLATALGTPYSCPVDTGETLWAIMGRLGDTGRATGSFGPEVAVAATASAFDRALGLSGRDPRWRG